MRASVVAGWALALGSCVGPERPLDPLAAAPELGRHELARIGGLDERAAYALTRVVDAALLPGERLAVADGGSQEIRLFDLVGTHVRSMGGEGNGPGEFRAIRSLALLPGGELLAWDIQRRRVTTFDTAGVVTRLFIVDASPLDALSPTFVGAFPDGSVALRGDINPMGLREDPEGARRDSITIGVFDASGSLAGIPLRFSGPERDFYSGDGGWGFDEPLFARDLVHALAGDVLFVAHTDSIHLRRFADGRETEPLEIARPTSTATDQDVEAERALRIQEVAPRAEARPDPRLPMPEFRRDMARRQLSRLEEMRALATLPAFADLIGSDDDHLWILDRTNYATAMSALHRLDERGQPLGKVTLPVAERVLSLTDEHLVTVITDELDVESVIVYGLIGLSER